MNEGERQVRIVVGPTVHWYLQKSDYYLILHREDGPAIEWTDGRCTWWLHGQIYTFAEWCDRVKLSEEEKTMLLLRLKSSTYAA